MTDLYRISHETSGLGEYDGISDNYPGGGLSVSSAAALGGTLSGLQATTLGNTSEASYGYVTISPPASKVIRVRHYIDPNSVSITDNASEFILSTAILNDPPYDTTATAYIALGKLSSNYILVGVLVDDDFGSFSVSYTLPQDAPAEVELRVSGASNSGSQDGSMSMWVNNTFVGSITNKDNFDIFNSASSVAFGVVSTAASANGTIYMDEIVVRDHDLHIGPRVSRSWFGPGWGT